MSSSNRLSRRRAAADRQTVSTILSRLDPADYLGRIGLESRLKELEEEEVDSVEATDTMASAELYFGGEPVIGSTGIESSFAGQAISSFQDLVAKLAIEDRRGLGERGPLPAHDAKLHVTGILRGSFGFRLEELDPVVNMFDTPLKDAVSKATRVLEAFSDANEDSFEEVLGNIDPRSVLAARNFFSLLGSRNATLRLEAGDTQLEIARPAIERASERALSSNVSEDVSVLRGRLAGLLPDAHMFELQVADSEQALSGRVAKSFDRAALAQMLRTHLDQPVKATVLTRKVYRRGQLARQSYTLQALSGPDLLEVGS